MGNNHHGKILRDFKTGRIGMGRMTKLLRDLPYSDVGCYAKIDNHRALRTGFPEVIFCQGKTPEQVAKIVAGMLEQSARVVLATRASQEVYAAVRRVASSAAYNEVARTILIGKPMKANKPSSILIVSAGTADIPVAEEAAATCEAMGHAPKRLYDVGVAGIHRLLKNRSKLFRAKVIIVVAGMDGALSSVVGGLAPCPVIAVPTSVGYGASFRGIAPLLTMLNSCAPGVLVVNIDNGFGAGYAAGMMLRKS